MSRHFALPIRRALAVSLLLAVWTTPFAAAQEKSPSWPVEITRDDMTVIVYSPQIDTFEGDSLTARAAIAVTPVVRVTPIGRFQTFRRRR